METIRETISRWAGSIRSRTYDLWIGLKPSRVGLLIVLVVLPLLLFETATRQGRDLLLEYAVADPSDDPLRHVWFYAATFSFGALVWITCWLSSNFRFEGEEETLVQYRRLFPRPPFKSGSEEATADAVRRVDRIYRVREWTPRILGILVPLIVAVAFVEFAGEDGIDNALICIAIALAIAFMLVPLLPETRKLSATAVKWATKRNLRSLAKTSEVVHGMAEMLDKKKGSVRNPATNWKSLKEQLGGDVLLALTTLSAIVVASIIIAAIWPLSFGVFFGPFPVAMLALTVLLIIGTVIVMLTKVSNFPLFLILALLALAVSFLDVHYVRFLKNTEEAVLTRATATELLSDFAAASDEEAASDEKSESKRPIVFVAAAGGGSRAAYWTATVLGELSATIPNFDKRLFLISGVSGGSLGALFYRAALSAAPGDGDRIKGIAKSAASGDFLSATLASMFIRDLIPTLPLSDRAEALERAWSESFDQACSRVLPKDPSGVPRPCPVNLEDGFLKLWKRGGPRWPALILNGTIVESGGRAVASSLRLDCESGLNCYVADVADIMKYEQSDLVASSAANVGARFPIIGPSGRLKIDKDGTERSVVDGGYFDNFGAVTLSQIMAELQRALGDKNLVPIVIQITSDPEFVPSEDTWLTRPYAGTDEPGGNQLFKPVLTMMNLRGALGRQAFLNLEAQARRMGGAYFHFGQCNVPASLSTQPPLGWMLSTSSLQLLDSYAAGQCDNARRIEGVKACLESPKPNCEGRYYVIHDKKTGTCSVSKIAPSTVERFSVTYDKKTGTCSVKTDPSTSERFSVTYDKKTETCSVSKTAPSTSERLSVMGSYDSRFLAERAKRERFADACGTVVSRHPQ